LFTIARKTLKFHKNIAGSSSEKMKNIDNFRVDRKQRHIFWPRRYSVFGVEVSTTTYNEALKSVIFAAKERRSACVSHLAVHGLITATQDRQLHSMLKDFEMVLPDGMPVKIALNILFKTNLPDRVCGPEFILRVCKRAADEYIGIYLYGSHSHVVYALSKNLMKHFPRLKIVGCEPSMFRKLTKAEDKALVQRINDSGAGIVFLGLGCPLQEKFAYDHKNKIKAVQICVGAAFDFHSGEKKMAPVWMQRYSLEWLFRLSQEPGRLWKRYFFTNSIFLLKLIFQLTGLKKYSS